MLKRKLYQMMYNRHMEKKTETKKQALDPKKRNLMIALVVVAVGLVIFWLINQAAPQRSVANYCQTYKVEKARLAKLPGDTWPAGIFNDELNDAGEIAKSVGRLEQVAPNDIRPDVATLRGIYQKIHDDPSQAISASLSGVSAEENVKTWTQKNCSN